MTKRITLIREICKLANISRKKGEDIEFFFKDELIKLHSYILFLKKQIKEKYAAGNEKVS